MLKLTMFVEKLTPNLNLCFIGQNITLARSYFYFLKKYKLLQNANLIEMDPIFYELKKLTDIKKLDPYQQYCLYTPTLDAKNKQELEENLSNPIEFITLNELNTQYWSKIYNKITKQQIVIPKQLENNIDNLYNLEHIMEMSDTLNIAELQKYLKIDHSKQTKHIISWRKLYLLKTEKIKKLPTF